MLAVLRIKREVINKKGNNQWGHQLWTDNWDNEIEKKTN